ncbi:MAG TPA: pseudouridine synthase [Pusillimonas sp.]|uniref:pseudouridine synthase n=1 Tax=Pusillimonas sp. TaxID=3040095 RepID=UPI002BB8D117|nr:pseudouridine synthase [Pusillimonas sp.]HUH87285.1 pseudouridine synthase [Pusillimonas sp.]
MRSQRNARLMAGAPLPVRDGVAPSRVYLPPGSWSTLLEFLVERFRFIPPEVLRQRLESGEIVDQRGVAQQAGAAYQPDRWLWYYRMVPDEPIVPFELAVLHQDAHLVVIDKPHFLASIPGGRHLRETALTRLRDSLELPQLTPVHRLDRDTAGVMLFCRDPAARGAYQRLFQSRQVTKEYEAIAAWRHGLALPCVYRSRLEPSGSHFIMHEVAGEPNSETRIELIERDGAWARYRLLPVTGRKHQLRAHMHALGIPIRNDGFYPVWRPAEQADDYARPLQLLARAVEFADPFTGELRRFESSRQLQGASSPNALAP